MSVLRARQRLSIAGRPRGKLFSRVISGINRANRAEKKLRNRFGVLNFVVSNVHGGLENIDAHIIGMMRT